MLSTLIFLFSLKYSTNEVSDYQVVKTTKGDKIVTPTSILHVKELCIVSVSNKYTTPSNYTQGYVCCFGFNEN